MDGDIISNEGVENRKHCSKWVKNAKANENAVIPGLVVQPLKKKRKYGPRKSKQKLLGKQVQVKNKEKCDKLLFNHANESEPDYNVTKATKQSKVLNPLLFSYLLNMVQLRRNNLFMSLSPVSS